MLLAIFALAIGWFAGRWWEGLVGSRPKGRFSDWKGIVVVAMLCLTAILIFGVGGYRG